MRQESSLRGEFMNKKWWKESVIYQIYPVSFKDTTGDGQGDLRGIIEKLDYLQELGVDGIWICPIYASPGYDNGYDISDYYGIDRKYGTMDDFDELLQKAHARNIRIIMDLVLNHSSHEHEWFIEASSSKDNPKRDYYIWREPKENGGYPNNWESYFSGSVWEFDERTQEYYMHLYAKEQPDLNWENPQVVRELHDMVKWWLEKGVDGFRFDAISHIVKAEGLPDADNPQNLPVVQAYHFFSNLDKVHYFLRTLNEDVLDFYDIMNVGEVSGLGPEQALDYVGEGRNELDMIFQFEHMFLDAKSGGTGKWDIKPWTLIDLKKIMSRWQTVLHKKGWNANYMSNHDQPRQVSRFGNDGDYRVRSAKMLATFLYTLQGTPYIYQGEEIGMTNVKFPSIDQYRDVETLNYYKQCIKQGIDEKEVMQRIWKKSRDNARTPMQWNYDEHAGFTDGQPWMDVNPNYAKINVEAARRDPDSIFHHYRKLIELRKKHEVIVYGDYRLVLPLHEEIYAFVRTWENEKLLVILNFFSGAPTFEWPEELQGMKEELLIANYEPIEGEDLYELNLRPYETRVYKLS